METLFEFGFLPFFLLLAPYKTKKLFFIKISKNSNFLSSLSSGCVRLLKSGIINLSHLVLVDQLGLKFSVYFSVSSMGFHFGFGCLFWIWVSIWISNLSFYCGNIYRPKVDKSMPFGNLMSSLAADIAYKSNMKGVGKHLWGTLM